MTQVSKRSVFAIVVIFLFCNACTSNENKVAKKTATDQTDSVAANIKMYTHT